MDGIGARPPPLPKAQSFQFAPFRPEKREQQRNYVFVDEQNRHRRLKVVRACDGCRRRKIKCDAANTNTWPCSACIRLKMTCVPPSLNFDNDDMMSTGSGEQSMSPPPKPQSKYDDDFNYSYPAKATASSPSLDRSRGTSEFSDPGVYAPRPYHHDDFYLTSYPSSMTTPSSRYDSSPQQRHNPISVSSPAASEVTGQSEEVETEITDALGDMKISEAGVAPYIVNRKALQDEPVLQEIEFPLPQQSTTDPTVRVPAEMMPSDQQAMQYFQYFFTHVHPYVPVINRTHFYRQWQTDRSLISPLILEGIFACSAMVMRQETEGNQWLALAAKHEESFKDIPRMSTIQGLALIIKARESVPKRGYYYRSWMSIVNLLTMAKDLELDQHFEIHQYKGGCGSPVHECIEKTLTWHTLFCLELMIGGPQGRFDFAVSLDSIDFDGDKTVQGLDEQELEVALQFTQLIRVIRNVRLSSKLYANLRNKKTDWARDPDFINHNQDFDKWMRDLPQHLQINYPSDGSAPWIPFHTIANFHVYHHLSVIMQHRPQLQSYSDSYDGSWKECMLTCYDAAKKSCQLQEAVFHNFGMRGLLCMQRGISFTIYSVLTCTMLHLVALTSPDPEISFQATEFFERHMRILEHCSKAWPMPEVQMQIDSLRQAFSADVNKPFELRQSFPAGSPAANSESSPPPSNLDYIAQGQDLELPYNSGSHGDYGIAAITPPRSGTQSAFSVDERSAVQVPTTLPQYGNTVQDHLDLDSSSWNPSRIFNQWSTAFEMPRSTPQYAQSPPTTNQNSRGMYSQPQQQQQMSYPNYDASGEQLPVYTTQWTTPGQASQPNYAAAPSSFVTPTMWREAVSSTYNEGMKRKWSGGDDFMGMNSKRTR